jgi:hypothetical protein
MPRAHRKGRGTEGSNPAPSSGESANPRFRSGRASDLRVRQRWGWRPCRRTRDDMKGGTKPNSTRPASARTRGGSGACPQQGREEEAALARHRRGSACNTWDREPVAGKRARSRRRQLKDRVDCRYNLSGETKRGKGQDKDYGSYASRDINTERSRTSTHAGRVAVKGT